MDYKQKIRYEITRRSFIVGIGKLGLTGVLLGRLGYLQLANQGYYRTMSDNNRLSAIMLPPVRGKISDINGELLASNIRKFDVVMRRRRGNKQQDVITKFANVMQLDIGEIDVLQAKYDNNKYRKEIVLFENIPWFQMVVIEENIMQMPGVFIRDSRRRYYHHPNLMCHILGYVSSLSDREKFHRNIRNTSEIKVGKSGIEKQYEEELSGTFGVREVESNARGQIVRELSHEPSVRGRDITLTIDGELQKLAYSLLPEQGAAMLVTKVHTGEVLCSLSTPTFDSNILTRKMSHQEWRNLQAAEGNPLINRVVQNLYPPGSVFKLITLIAALEEGVLPERKIFCNGKPVLGGKSFRCWKRFGHGNINMHQALKGSCNSYIFNLAKEIGAESILRVAEKMGFGSLTGIDIPEEVRGFLPSARWKKKRFKQNWTVGDSLNLSIGQGFMLGTLAQITQMTNIIATGGNIAELHINQQHPVSSQLIDINPEYFDILKKGMYAIVNSPGGTAFASRIAQGKHKFAGKTGTAQVQSKRGEDIDLNTVQRRKSRNHAVFTGYGPVDSPQFSVSVIVDHGGGGGKVAAPITKEVFKYLFTNHL